MSEKKFEYKGFPCVAYRPTGTHWCGYAGFPEGHLLHGVDYSQRVKVARPEELIVDKVSELALWCNTKDDMEQGIFGLDSVINVHGSITYSKKSPLFDSLTDSEGCWWFGIDFAHAGDTGGSADETMAEVREMIDQLLRITKDENGMLHFVQNE